MHAIKWIAKQKKSELIDQANKQTYAKRDGRGQKRINRSKKQTIKRERGRAAAAAIY